MGKIFCDQISKLGIEYKEIFEDIIQIENFISKEEVDSLLNLIKETKEEAWTTAYMDQIKRFAFLKYGRDDLDNLVAEGKVEITDRWTDKTLVIDTQPIVENIRKKIKTIVKTTDENLIFTGGDTIQRMYEGVKLHEHTDQHTDPSVQYASILYLNDDYSGGELFFPNLNIEIKPKPGTLLIFPGSDKYNHGVRFVNKGPVRYVIVGFIKIKDFYENNKF